MAAAATWMSRSFSLLAGVLLFLGAALDAAHAAGPDLMTASGGLWRDVVGARRPAGGGRAVGRARALPAGGARPQRPAGRRLQCAAGRHRGRAEQPRRHCAAHAGRQRRALHDRGDPGHGARTGGEVSRDPHVGGAGARRSRRDGSARLDAAGLPRDGPVGDRRPRLHRPVQPRRHRPVHQLFHARPPVAGPGRVLRVAADRRGRKDDGAHPEPDARGAAGVVGHAAAHVPARGRRDGRVHGVPRRHRSARDRPPS